MRKVVALKMRRKLAVLLAGSAMSVGMVVLSAPAGAAGTGCPSGGDWNLLPIDFYIGALDNGNVHDQNGDGLACFKVNKGQTDKNGVPSFTWKENTNPTP